MGINLHRDRIGNKLDNRIDLKGIPLKYLRQNLFLMIACYMYYRKLVSPSIPTTYWGYAMKSTSLMLGCTLNHLSYYTRLECDWCRFDATVRESLHHFPMYCSQCRHGTNSFCSTRIFDKFPCKLINTKNTTTYGGDYGFCDSG